MSLTHSPSIVTSGLEFYYDILNTKKSWKGKPTTNLVPNVGLNFFNAIVGAYLGVENGWKKYSLSGTWAAGTYPYCMSITTNIFTGGVDYSSSIYIKTNVIDKFDYKFTGMNYVNQPQNSGGASFSVTHNDGSIYVGRSGFNYISTTSQTGYLLSKPLADGTTFNPSTDFIWIKEGQIEEGLFATPYTNGTRSNTQSLLDMTNNSVITATELTYNADGTMIFDGINDYISIANPLDTSLPYSAIQWLRPSVALPDTTSSGSRVTPFVGPGPTWNPGWWMTARVFRVHAKTEYRDVTINWVGDTSWHQVGQIFDGTTLYTIIDGEVILGSRTAYSPPLQNTIYIGAETIAGSTITNWDGEIEITKIYNKALTPAEVKQNFEALRGRFGI